MQTHRNFGSNWREGLTPGSLARRLVHRELRHRNVTGDALAAPISPVAGEVVLGERELVENSIGTIVDNWPLVLPHVIDQVAVRSTFRIMLEQENDAFNRSLYGMSVFNGGIRDGGISNRVRRDHHTQGCAYARTIAAVRDSGVP